MARALLPVLLGLAVASSGCAWTAEQRAEVIESVSEVVTEKLSGFVREKIDEGLGKVEEKLNEVVVDAVKKADVSPEAADAILGSVRTLVGKVREEVYGRLDEETAKLKEKLRAGLEEKLPPPADESNPLGAGLVLLTKLALMYLTRRPT